MLRSKVLFFVLYIVYFKFKLKKNENKQNQIYLNWINNFQISEQEPNYPLEILFLQISLLKVQKNIESARIVINSYLMNDRPVPILPEPKPRKCFSEIFTVNVFWESFIKQIVIILLFFHNQHQDFITLHFCSQMRYKHVSTINNESETTPH